MPPATATVTAVPDNSPPTTSPYAAPSAVSPRHQMPSTSSGHSVDAATAKASPTLRDSSSPDVTSDSGIGISPPTTAATRKSRTRPRSTSVDNAPAMLTSSPDDVAKNAAMAPAATSAASSWPAAPPMAAPGASSTAASAVPVINSCGTDSLANAPNKVGNR